MKRRFVCTETDLSDFANTCRRFFWLKGSKTEMSDPTFCRRMMDEQVEMYRSEVISYRLQLDYDTLDAIADWKRSEGLDYFSMHMALHHMIWQVVDAHNRGVISLSENKLCMYENATRDCLA